MGMMVDTKDSINLKSNYIANSKKTHYKDDVHGYNEKTSDVPINSRQSSISSLNVSAKSTLPVDDSHKGEKPLNNANAPCKESNTKTTSLTATTLYRNNLDSTQHSPRKLRHLSGCERSALARLRRASSWLLVVCCFPLWLSYCVCIREDPGADYLTEDELEEELAQDWCMPCYYRGYKEQTKTSAQILSL